jgi:hypothetical protein
VGIRGDAMEKTMLSLSIPVSIEHEQRKLNYEKSGLERLEKKLSLCKPTQKSKITGLKHAIKVQKLKIKRTKAIIMAHDLKSGKRCKHEIIKQVEQKYNVVARNLDEKDLAIYIGAL